jgi:hypothetical protein
MDDAGDSVSQNDSGLVCAINGYPANGVQDCTSKSGADFYYWSYWQGNPYTNTWSYANSGPAEHQVQDGGTYVEGWRYQNPGPDSASAPAPSISPSAAFARACPGVTPEPTAPGGGSPTTTTAPPAAPTTTTSVAGSTATTSTAPATTPHSTTPTTSAAKSRTSAGVAGATTTTAKSSGQTATSTTSPTDAKSHRTTASALSGTASRRGGGGSGTGSGSGGSPILPIAVVAAVIVLLGGITYFRWRKRPAEEVT